MFPTPRPFQERAHLALREGARNKHRCQILMAATGAGKTYCGMRLINEALERGKRAIFACDRITLIDQTSEVADRYGLRHGVIQGNHWRTDYSKPFQIASIQTLASRGWPDADLVVIDECFVSGTEIATPSGPKPIELVRCGDLVYNATGVGIVLGKSAKPANNRRIVKVELENGITIRCTAEHKFFTTESWVQAGRLAGKSIIGIESMPCLWNGNFPNSKTECEGELAGTIGKGMGSHSDLLAILCKEIKKSNARGENKNQSSEIIKEDWAQTKNSRRERNRIHTTSIDAIAETWDRLGGGVYFPNKNETIGRLPLSLQAGHSESGNENCNRSGRGKSLRDSTEKTRFQERFSFGVSRVVSVEIEESGSNEAVFNLHVSGHPSYFANGSLVHNCHCQYKGWTEHVKTTSAHVIGLSATPFAKGLGNIFSNLVNAATMAELTEQGTLVPMRVFSCTQADMKGAATSGGEWTDRAAEERELDIVGDVILEWQRYGENRKTVGFGPTIAWCEETARQFRAAGIRAEVTSAETDVEEHHALLKEFSKEDSSIKILLSVEKLAKGFDQPDVSCIIDCRPLRRSLSTAIQMWGRGLRSHPGKADCLARDTLVLTDKGEVKIQDVTLDHKVWDGLNFVHHHGAVCRGVRFVIYYDGLTATPDHEVMTNDGWKRFEEAASRRLRIARTGFGGNAIRFIDHNFKNDKRNKLQFARGSSVCAMLKNSFRSLSQHPQTTRYNSGVSSLQREKADYGSKMAIRALPRLASAMYKSAIALFQPIWSAWDSIPIFWGQRGGTLGCKYAWCSGSEFGVRQNRQQRTLRAGKPSMGIAGCKYEQHQSFRWKEVVYRFSEKTSRGEVCGQNSSQIDSNNVGRGNYKKMESPVIQAEREVWDILNAGPLQRFTAGGRLVHNCILLSHSGNIERFKEDFEDIYWNGLDALDCGEKLDATVRKDDEEEKPDSQCPKCGHKPFFKRCMSCGYERQAKSLIEHQPGEMREMVMFGKKPMAENEAHLFQQALTYAKQHSLPDRQWGRAANIFKDITGRWPPSGWQSRDWAPVAVSANVLNRIRYNNIRYAKRVG